MKIHNWLLGLLLLLGAGVNGFSQTAVPPCEGDGCKVETNSVVADTPHVRCLAGNSCGSGTICGIDADGAYVVSNAHVWGTQLGKVVTVDCVSGGTQKRVQGRLVFAGYSSTRMVDFAIAQVPNLTSKRYMPMLKTEPTSAPYATTGSPRCVWPQVNKPFNDMRNYGDGLITGTPDAIGGQSGSAIFNASNQQIGLLTWSINGRCAGQKTSKLWQVATSRNVMLADPRPDGLTEVGENHAICEDGVFGVMPEVNESPVVCEDGVFGAFPGVAHEVQFGTRPVTENVIASTAAASMQTMPIWVDDAVKPPPPPGDCPEGCYKLSKQEFELIEFIRRQETKDGERSIPWAQIIAKILELIQLFQAGRS